jgi:hypothetical protein
MPRQSTLGRFWKPGRLPLIPSPPLEPARLSGAPSTQSQYFGSLQDADFVEVDCPRTQPIDSTDEESADYETPPEEVEVNVTVTASAASKPVTDHARMAPPTLRACRKRPSGSDENLRTPIKVCRENSFGFNERTGRTIQDPKQGPDPNLQRSFSASSRSTSVATSFDSRASHDTSFGFTTGPATAVTSFNSSAQNSQGKKRAYATSFTEGTTYSGFSAINLKDSRKLSEAAVELKHKERDSDHPYESLPPSKETTVGGIPAKDYLRGHLCAFCEFPPREFYIVTHLTDLCSGQTVYPPWKV